MRAVGVSVWDEVQGCSARELRMISRWSSFSVRNWRNERPTRLAVKYVSTISEYIVSVMIVVFLGPRSGESRRARIYTTRIFEAEFSLR